MQLAKLNRQNNKMRANRRKVGSFGYVANLFVFNETSQARTKPAVIGIHWQPDRKRFLLDEKASIPRTYASCSVAKNLLSGP
jgi:hypothetical protein